MFVITLLFYNIMSYKSNQIMTTRLPTTLNQDGSGTDTVYSTSSFNLSTIHIMPSVSRRQYFSKSFLTFILSLSETLP